MKSNWLLLIPSKTDFLWCAMHRRCNQLSPVPLEVCGVRVPPTGRPTVRDLGILYPPLTRSSPDLSHIISRGRISDVCCGLCQGTLVTACAVLWRRRLVIFIIIIIDGQGC